jgi:hypothetical protein
MTAQTFTKRMQNPRSERRFDPGMLGRTFSYRSALPVYWRRCGCKCRSLGHGCSGFFLQSSAHPPRVPSASKPDDEDCVQPEPLLLAAVSFPVLAE